MLHKFNNNTLHQLQLNMKHPKLASNTNINQTNFNLNLFNIANNKINMLNKATRHKINMECINLQQIFMVRR